jgi:hypothetical protein
MSNSKTAHFVGTNIRKSPLVDVSNDGLACGYLMMMERRDT